MGDSDLRVLLDRIRGVRHACDLDLLLFFHRHPMSLLTNEQLVASVGHERERVTRSVDALIEAGLLTRSPNPAHAARLYVLQGMAAPDPLKELLRIASTRPGRQRLLALLDTTHDAAQAPTPTQARLRARVIKIA